MHDLYLYQKDSFIKLCHLPMTVTPVCVMEAGKLPDGYWGMWTWRKKVWIGRLKEFRIERSRGCSRVSYEVTRVDGFSLSAEQSEYDLVRKYCDSPHHT